TPSGRQGGYRPSPWTARAARTAPRCATWRFCLDPPRVGAWSLRRLDAAWLLVYLDGIVVHTLQATEDAVLSPLAISRKYLSRTRAVGWTVWPGPSRITRWRISFAADPRIVDPLKLIFHQILPRSGQYMTLVFGPCPPDEMPRTES